MPSEIITAAFTAFFGVVVYVAGQILQRFIFEPILEQRKIIAEVSFAVLFYANVGSILSTAKEIEEAKNALRTLAGRLRATVWLIPFYGLFAFLRIVPKRHSVMEAGRNLIGYSNSLQNGTTEQRKIIAKSLGFDED